MKVADLFARLSLRPDKGSFDAASRAIGYVKGALVGLVAIKTVSWFAGLVKDTTAVASTAVETAAKLGITAEAVQELGFAAGQAGMTQDALANAMGKLANNAQLAKSGSAAAASAFRKAGVNTKALLDGTIPLDGALEQIADRFASMQDGAEKQNLAKELFGRSGRELIPLLNAGSKGIKELREEAQALGGVIDNETAASLEEFGDQGDKVSFALKGIRNAAVKELLPTLKVLVQQFLEWVKANKKLIAQRIATIMKGLITVLVAMAKTVGVLIRVFEGLIQNWKIVLVMVGSLGTAMVLLQAKSVGAAMAAARAWIAAAAPIIAVGLLAGGLILIVQDLWNGFRGGHSVIMKLYEVARVWIGEKLTEVLGKASDKVREFLGLKKGGYVSPKSASQGFTNFTRNAGIAGARNPREEGERSAFNRTVAQNRVQDAMTGTPGQVAASRNQLASLSEGYRNLGGFRRLYGQASVSQAQAGLAQVSIIVNAKTDANPDEIGKQVSFEFGKVWRELSNSGQ